MKIIYAGSSATVSAIFRQFSAGNMAGRRRQLKESPRGVTSHYIGLFSIF